MTYDGSAAAATASPVLQMRVAPEPRHGRAVRRRILDFCAAWEIDAARVHDFITAIGEAVANAVEHSKTQREIEITVWMADRTKIYATVVDHGVGFVDERVAPLAPLPDWSSERGRGLPIMRSCTDVYGIRSTPGVGTAVILGTHL
jgi:anti-sigma regulatory factor (Ser/Thr protein kinase)